MEMNIDTFITIGKTHNICQDYIFQTDNAVILADGCSAAKNSEIGAMLLCMITSKYLKRYKDYLDDIEYTTMGETIISNAEVAATILQAPKTCLNATLMMAYSDDDTIYTKRYGDGSIIWVTNDDVVHISSIEYTKNSPHYLNYWLDPINHRKYMQGKTQTMKYYNSNGDYQEGVASINDVNASEIEFDKDDIKVLLIASDGVSSFIQKQTKDAEAILNVAVSLTKFKRTHGEFLKRRLIRALLNYDEQNIHNFDDLAIGGFVRKE